MERISIKQGQTFLVYGYYREKDKVTPKDLTGVTITSKIRDRTDIIIAELVITITNAANGTYTLTYPTGTNLWPTGELYWDIFETIAGVTYPSQTIIIEVERGQSR